MQQHLRIFYNVGYCNNIEWYEFSALKNEWFYLDEVKNKVNEDFMMTTAHELGHSILSSYGGEFYSFTHDGSSGLNQTPNNKKSYISQKKSGEIYLMHYFIDDPTQSKYDYELVKVSEKDLLGLI